MATKHDCEGRVCNGKYSCSRSGIIERDGKRYCWQHDPERVEADREKHRAIRLAKMDGLYARRARNAKLAALVTEEMASLLSDLSAGCDHSAWLAAEKGWAMAASIREALGLEANDAKR